MKVFLSTVTSKMYVPLHFVFYAYSKTCDFICKNTIVLIAMLCNPCVTESLPLTESSVDSRCSRKPSARPGKRFLRLSPSTKTLSG